MAYGQARYAQEGPRYRLIVPFYGPDDVLYPEDTELEWDGPPNEHMEPLNQAAEDRIRLYLSSLPPPAGPIRANGGTPDLADIMEAAMRNRPRYPEERQGTALPEGPKERVMAALSRDELPDPADLAELAEARAQTKEITIPRKDPTVPLQGTVDPPAGTPMRRRGRPPGSKVKVTGAAGKRKPVVKLMGNIRDVGPEAQFIGPEPITQDTQLRPGSTISQG